MFFVTQAKRRRVDLWVCTSISRNDFDVAVCYVKNGTTGLVLQVGSSTGYRYNLQVNYLVFLKIMLRSSLKSLDFLIINDSYDLGPELATT